MRYIFCPFDQKDLGKSYGAMWDANRKSWYIPDHLDTEISDALNEESFKEITNKLYKDWTNLVAASNKEYGDSLT